MKNRIRLTESQLTKIIAESVKKVLREEYESMDHRLYFDNPDGQNKLVAEGQIGDYAWTICSRGDAPRFYIFIPEGHPVYYCKENNWLGDGSITRIVEPIVREVTYWRKGVLGVDFMSADDFINRPGDLRHKNGKKWTVEELINIIKRYVQELKEMENDNELAEYLQSIDDSYYEYNGVDDYNDGEPVWR